MQSRLVFMATFVFAILRFVVPVSGEINHGDVFKDLAHVFVGGLFGAAIYSTHWEDIWVLKLPTANWRLWILAIGLTTLEVIAFFIRKA